MRITVACPEAFIPDGRNLAMILGYGPADVDTYKTAQWQDTSGNKYAVASAMIFGEFVGKAQRLLIRPEWDTEPYKVSMAAARRAQAAVHLVDTSVEGYSATAVPSRIVAVLGDDAQAALLLMGLSAIAVPE